MVVKHKGVAATAGLREVQRTAVAQEAEQGI